MALPEDSSPSSIISHQYMEKELSKKLSAKATEELYALGYGFYDNGKYDKAVHFFRLLTLLNPEKRKYWMGLGASYQMLKEEKHAVHCYGVAALLDQNDPYAHFHAAESLFSLGKRKLGKEALEAAEAVATSQPKQDSALLSRIALMKEENILNRRIFLSYG